MALAYSGGLESSAAVVWLKDQGAEVVAVTLDLGQRHDLEAVRDRALALGAVRAHVLDRRETFARDIVLRSLAADALYEHRAPMASALARPLVARTLVEIAGIEHATALAHAGGAQGRPVALDRLLLSIAPSLPVMTPAREWGMTRERLEDYLRVRRLPMPPGAALHCHAESNLWGRSLQCGDVAATWAEPPEELFVLTRPARECPDEPAFVELAFERGVPSALNGVALPLLELVASLTLLAAAHGVGRVDMVEHRAGRKTVREMAEAPAAVLLYAAHRELRKVPGARELERFYRSVSAEYADLVYSGRWFSPLREALDGFVAAAQEHVTGSVRMKLFKGGFSMVGCTTASRPPARTRPLLRITQG